MSEQEIELLQQKKSFILRITNKVLVGMFCSTVLIVWAIAYYCGGFVTEVKDHERRITTIETRMDVIQTAKNQVRAEKNNNVNIKNGQ